MADNEDELVDYDEEEVRTDARSSQRDGSIPGLGFYLGYYLQFS